MKCSKSLTFWCFDVLISSRQTSLELKVLSMFFIILQWRDTGLSTSRTQKEILVLKCNEI